MFIGQFNKPENPGKSTKCWNIHDMSKYKHRKPRYVREWYLRLKKKFKKLNLKNQAVAEEENAGQTQEAGGSAEKARRDTVDPSAIASGKGIGIDAADQIKDASYEDDQGAQQDSDNANDLQEQYYEELINKMEFSESEDENDPHLIKNAAQYLQYKPEDKGSKLTELTMNRRYFDHFQNKHPPNIARYNRKWLKQKNWNA